MSKTEHVEKPMKSQCHLCGEVSWVTYMGISPATGFEIYNEDCTNPKCDKHYMQEENFGF